MPDRNHLQRLSNVWAKNPTFFVTACTYSRRRLLATRSSAEILTSAWQASPKVSGWVIGRYVIMPDQVHFFARPYPDGKALAAFMRDWKRWTAHRLARSMQIAPPIWQAEFFDHLLRSAESYSEKWDYVHANPERAGLVSRADAWPYAGECELLGF